jgi:hypothetical protein
MKSITNDSFQGFEIHFRTPKGVTSHWLKPNETIVVPTNYITSQIKNMQQMRLLRVKSA